MPDRALTGDRKPVAIIMGSQSDWATMRHTAHTLETLGIGYDARIISAHRTPERLYAFARGAKDEGFQLIIAGAENEFSQKLTDDAFGFRDLFARTISMKNQTHIDLADSRTVTDFQSNSGQLLQG